MRDIKQMSFDPGIHICTGLNTGQVSPFTWWKWSHGKEKARLSEEMVTSHILCHPRNLILCKLSQRLEWALHTPCAVSATGSQLRDQDGPTIRNPRPSLQRMLKVSLCISSFPVGGGLCCLSSLTKKKSFQAQKGWGGRDLKEWQCNCKDSGSSRKQNTLTRRQKRAQVSFIFL